MIRQVTVRSSSARAPIDDSDAVATTGRRHRGVLVLAAITALIVVGDLAVKGYHRYVQPVPGDVVIVLNVGSEANVAAWWNTTLLLAVACMGVVAMVLAGPGARPSRGSWLALIVAATCLSLDEAARIHERLGVPVQNWANDHGVRMPTFAWVLPGTLIAVVGVVCAVLWVRSLPRDLRIGLLGALAMYLTGALVVEAINGWTKRQGASAAYVLGTSFEETLEMGACLVALIVLSRAVALTRDRGTGGWSIRLREDLR